MSTGASATYVKSPVTKKKWRVRSFVSLIFFIIGALVLPLTVVAQWGHQTLTDADQYINTVGPLAENPDVQAALSTTVSDTIIEQIDTSKLASGIVGSLIPNEQLSGLISGPIKAGIDGLIRGGVDRFIASDAFQESWIRINQAAQKGLVAALSGEPSGPVEIEGNQLVLNIQPLLEEIQQSLVDDGVVAAGIISVPSTGAQIVLMDSPQLKQARAIYAAINPILSVILLINAAIFVLAVLFASRRARTTVTTGIVLLLWAVILHYALKFGESNFVNAFKGTIFVGAADAFYSQLLVYLLLAVQGMVVLGVLVILLGWYCGSTKAAVKVRGSIDSGLASVGERLPHGMAVIGRPIREYAPFFRWGLLIIWIIAVFGFGTVTLESALGWSALLLGVLTVLQIVMHAPAEGAPEHRPSEAT